MRDHKVTITFDGIQAEDGYIRLNDFISELGKFIEIARNAEEIISGEAGNSIYFRVIDLKHSSPASVTVEACVKNTKYDIRTAMFNEMSDTMEKLKAGQHIEGNRKFYLIESIRNFTEPVGKRISGLTVMFDEKKITMDQEFKARANLYVAPEESGRSTFRGMLDVINVHRRQRIFWLYPDIGPYKIQCIFPDALLELARTSLGKRVEVEGVFKYKVNAPYPYAAEVESLITFPSDNELPTFKEMFGIAPDLTLGLSCEDYIRKIRNEN